MGIKQNVLSPVELSARMRVVCLEIDNAKENANLSVKDAGKTAFSSNTRSLLHVVAIGTMAPPCEYETVMH